MLFVFDLDFTLWDCGGTWCDCTRPPFSRDGSCVTDSSGRNILLYKDVRGIIRDLKARGHQLAAASRTHEPSWAVRLLELLELYELFDYTEIYPGPKLPHFRSLRRKSGVEFRDMAFFDDEERNIRDISALGVSSVYVENGLSRSLVREILPDF